jgi:tRNA-binding EMAP/Myf-like protein
MTAFPFFFLVSSCNRPTSAHYSYSLCCCCCVCCCLQEHESAPHLAVLQVQTDEPASVAEKEKLLRPGFRQVVAGLQPSYKTFELVGKRVALLANLKLSSFKGVRSEGMLLTAVKGRSVGLLVVAEEAAAAAKLQPGALCVPRDCVADFKPNYDVKKDLKKLDLMTRGEAGTVHFGGSELLVDAGNGTFLPVVGDKVGEGAKIQ